MLNVGLNDCETGHHFNCFSVFWNLQEEIEYIRDNSNFQNCG